MIFFSKTIKTAVAGTKRAIVRVLSFRERERESSFSLDFRPFEPSVLDGARAKSIYAARATRRHRFGGVPTTPRGRDLFLLVLFFG